MHAYASIASLRKYGVDLGGVNMFSMQIYMPRQIGA